jgi:hypothetical protein
MLASKMLLILFLAQKEHMIDHREFLVNNLLMRVTVIPSKIFTSFKWFITESPISKKELVTDRLFYFIAVFYEIILI